MKIIVESIYSLKLIFPGEANINELDNNCSNVDTFVASMVYTWNVTLRKNCSCLIRLLCFNGPGAEIPVQVVPQGIKSIYGSDSTMGCASPLVERDGVVVCDDKSYLADVCSPTIDTSTSNWASQLVTVRKTTGQVIGQTTFDGVVLTFDFDRAVYPDSIELDLFLCSRWNSMAQSFFVYADQNSSLVFSSTSRHIRGATRPRPSCDSLSTVRFPVGDIATSTTYHSWHISAELNQFNEWAYVGEVRFFISSIINPGKYIYVYINTCMAYIPT